MAWVNPPTRFTKTVEGDFGKFVKRIALRIFRNLIARSPVDTGRFRGNWIVTLKRRSTRTSSNTSQSTAISRARSEINRIAAFVTVFITNNLPYARRLNEGSSDQAPANFVEQAVRRGVRGR